MILRESRLESSYSQIDKFLKCPMQWKLRYEDKIKLAIKNKHLEYGLAVHETLEYFFNELKQGFHIPLKLIERSLEYNIEKREIQFDSLEEERDWISRAIEMLSSLLNQDGEINKLMMNAKILGVELPFEIPIETASREFINPKTNEVEVHDTVWIIGFIDLVLETDDGIIVIDHKSGKKKFPKSKLRQDLQFPIYALAVKQIFGKYPVKCYYNFTKLSNFQKVNVTDEITLDMEEAMNKRGAKKIYCIPPEEAILRINRVFAQMYKPSKKAVPTPLCYWCDYGFHNSGDCKRSKKWKPKKG